MNIINTKLSSKDLASKRLNLILIHDRADLNPKFLELIKGEIIEVIGKYIDINNSEAEVKLIANAIEERSSVLVANIPIRELEGR